MSKRKVHFAEPDELSKKPRATTAADTRLHSGKYALESDEEDDDEQEQGKKLDSRDFVEMGREDTTIEFDDEVKITPFNFDEELEEGNYDESGCFHWKKKDKDEIRDAWLDEVDWTNVRNYKLNNQPATNEPTTDDTQFNELKTLTAMLTIMQPGETVTRTIKRLGALTANHKPKPSNKQRRLLPGELPPAAAPERTPEEIKRNKLILDEMSGLADQFVSDGQLDIYQETYERLKSKFDQLQSSKATTADSSFDMYGDNDVTASVSTAKDQANMHAPGVIWEYISDEKSKEDLKGPFTTEHMIGLMETEGKLDKDKVRCRRVGTEQFYSIKRIDFDLYLD